MKTVKAYVASSQRERLEAELRANVKPRAGEHTKAAALHELIADYRHLAWPEDDRAVEAMRLDLIERALREHSNKMKNLEAERDQLRAREKELALQLALCLRLIEDEGLDELHGDLAECTRAALSKVRGA